MQYFPLQNVAFIQNDGSDQVEENFDKANENKQNGENQSEAITLSNLLRTHKYCVKTKENHKENKPIIVIEDSSDTSTEEEFLEIKQMDQNGEEAQALTLGQPLSDFLLQLEDYVATIPDAVTAHYLNTSGFEPRDQRLLRLISIAAQKFISDIANDALQHCKMRSSNSSSSHSNSKNAKSSKDRRYCLTMEDLTPALAEFGITVKKPQYYV